MEEKPRLRPEPLDYTLAALSPIFVIGMIGSLVYFLVTVLYRGDFPSRLMWILGLFTIASVLIARIAIEYTRAYSLGYMIALGAATFVAAPGYLVAQGGSMFGGMAFLFVMIVTIAFLADRITFDCTSMNEHSESSGIGLLQSLGLFRSNESTSKRLKGADGATRKNRKHNPGVWILYFSLLAIPLFGLGQFFVEAGPNRKFAFNMIFCYLFCSFCLLVMIALLTLRKYLRERDIEMDQSFAWRWLGIGLTAVTFLVLFFAIIPLPSTSLVKWDLPFQLKSRDDLRANQFGWGDEGVADNNPDAAKVDKGQQADEANSNQGNKAQKPDPSGQAGDKPGRGPGNHENGESSAADQQSASERKPGESSSPLDQNGKSNQKGEQKSDRQADGQPSSQAQPSDQGSKDQNQKDGSLKSNDDQRRKSESSKGDRNLNNDSQRKGDVKDQKQANPNQAAQNEPNKPNPNEPQPNQQQANKPKERADQPGPNRPPKAQPPPSRTSSWSIQWNPSNFLQWLMLLALVLICLIYGWINRQAIIEFIAMLMGHRKKAERVAEPTEGEVTVKDPYPPFASYSNPFASSSQSPEQIVTRMFQALLSWGYERRVVRNEEETPDEYVRRLAKKYPEQLDNFRILGFLYSRIAYARGKVSKQEISPLKDLWKWLQTSV